MSNERFESVWDAIEDTPEQAENMRLRSALMRALSAHIVTAGINQSAAAELFGVTQPRVSDLMRGKINLFGLDALVNMVAAAGLHVELRVRGPQGARGPVKVVRAVKARRPAAPGAKKRKQRRATKTRRAA